MMRYLVDGMMQMEVVISHQAMVVPAPQRVVVKMVVVKIFNPSHQSMVFMVVALVRREFGAMAVTIKRLKVTVGIHLTMGVINLLNKWEGLDSLEVIMAQYVVFIKNGEAKALLKKAVTHKSAQQMKRNGFSKHFMEVEAENEKDAIKKLNEHNNEYLSSLGEFSGNVFIISFVVIILALIYWLI